MDFDRYAELVDPYIKKAVKVQYDHKSIAQILKERVNILSEIEEMLDFFDELPDYDIELYRNKKMKTDPEIARNSLIEARSFLESIYSYDHDTIYTGIVDLAQKMGVKNGVLMYPIRVALSGKAFTPGGAIELSCILGKDETLRRIDIALKKLS